MTGHKLELKQNRQGSKENKELLWVRSKTLREWFIGIEQRGLDGDDKVVPAQETARGRLQQVIVGCS